MTRGYSEWKRLVAAGYDSLGARYRDWSSGSRVISRPPFLQ